MSKYHNIGKERFIGDSGWEGWPGTENNSMVVQYRDKKGNLNKFYKGCFFKKRFSWEDFFKKTYVCKDEDDLIYFLVLGASGSIYIYNDNQVVSSSKYYNISKDRFIGQSGWEGWPGTEINSMVVKYRDKEGRVKSFYKGCFLKKSFF